MSGRNAFERCSAGVFGDDAGIGFWFVLRLYRAQHPQSFESNPPDKIRAMDRCAMTTTPPKLDNKYKETKAAELLTHHGKTTAGIIGMGRVLTEVKAALPRGEYTEWMSKNFKFSNATSLRYRRSFAFATSIGDFGGVKLEIMALYRCGEIHEAISKPVKDPDHREALETGLKAVVKAARKRLIDEDEALRIFNDAFVSKHAELNAVKAAAKNESAANDATAIDTFRNNHPDPDQPATPELEASEPESAADYDTMQCDGNGAPVEKVMLMIAQMSDEQRLELKPLVMETRQFSEALQIVMRENSDNQWNEQAKVIGETEFRKFAAHVNAALKTFDTTSNVVKLKADRAEAKSKKKVTS
jgi:hypothetical protein